jgi:hypothetical protein
MTRSPAGGRLLGRPLLAVAVVVASNWNGWRAAAQNSPSQPAAQASTCRWAGDGDCDEPYICPRGTDTADCQAAGGAGGHSSTQLCPILRSLTESDACNAALPNGLEMCPCPHGKYCDKRDGLCSGSGRCTGNCKDTKLPWSTLVMLLLLGFSLVACLCTMCYCKTK